MKPKPSHGPGGAANIGFAMFGARPPLCSAADGTGSGAAAPITATTTATPGAPAPQAQPGAAPAIDETAVKAIEERTRNSLFAELRRNGALKNSALKALDATGQQAAPQAQPGDPSALRSLDRAISKLSLGDKLTDAQWKRAERDFQLEQPADAEAWTKEYFPGLVTAAGAAAATTTATTTTATTAAPQNARPASGAAGAPARGTVPLDQMNVLEMSEQDVAHHVNRVGPTAFKLQYAAALRGTRIKLTP